MKKLMILGLLLFMTACSSNTDQFQIIGIDQAIKYRYSAETNRLLFPKGFKVKKINLQVFYGTKAEVNTYCTSRGRKAVGCAFFFGNNCSIFVPYPEEHLNNYDSYSSAGDYKNWDKKTKEMWSDGYRNFATFGHEGWHCIKGKFHG
jgi:hypothetical protein